MSKKKFLYTPFKKKVFKCAIGHVCFFNAYECYVSIDPQCCTSVGQMSRARRQITPLKRGVQKVTWGTQSCGERDSAELWHCWCLDILLCSLLTYHICSQIGSVIFSNWATVSVCRCFHWSYVWSAFRL